MSLLPSQQATDRWLDVIENAEPITATRIISLTSAVILGALDSVFHVVDNPVLASALAYLVLSLVTWAWDRGQVWSNRSHAAAVEAARDQGVEAGRQV